ncbi:MAG: ATP-dependent zinc protease family protein [Gammaproteobacteria bacterium]
MHLPESAILPLLIALLPQVVCAKEVVGWVERIKLYPGEMILKAKVDTGAKNSSINARNIDEFTRDGDPWIGFEVADLHGHKVKFERKLERRARIQRHFGKLQTRPVVVLGVCMGNIYKDIEVNLVNRKGFLYPVLIGRSFLKENLLVDAALTFTREPVCQGAGRDG